MKRALTVLALATLLTACEEAQMAFDKAENPPASEQLDDNSGSPEERFTASTGVSTLDVFKSAPGKVYRIPSVAKLNNGDLVVFAEERAATSDSSHADIVFQVVSNGALSGPMRYMPLPTSSIRGNPQPIVLANGDIFVAYNIRKANTASYELCAGTADNRQHFQRASQADLNFTRVYPVMNGTTNKTITSPTHGYEYQWTSAAGNGSSLIMSTYKLGPEATCSQRFHEADRSEIYYSRDNGVTFTRMSMANSPVGNNETSIAITPRPGYFTPEVMLWARHYNRFAMPSGGDGYHTRVLTDRTVNEFYYKASVLVHGGLVIMPNDTYVSYPDPIHSGVDDREDLHIVNRRTQADMVIHEGKAAYSNLLKINDNIMVVVYENGVNDPYEKITLKWVNPF